MSLTGLGGGGSGGFFTGMCLPGSPLASGLWSDEHIDFHTEQQWLLINTSKTIKGFIMCRNKKHSRTATSKRNISAVRFDSGNASLLAAVF